MNVKNAICTPYRKVQLTDENHTSILEFKTGSEVFYQHFLLLDSHLTYDGNVFVPRRLL